MGAVQGDVPHAVHRIWPVSSAISHGHVADHALNDLRCHLLRSLPWARHQPDSES